MKHTTLFLAGCLGLDVVFMVGEYHLAGILAEEGGEHVGASLLLWTCLTGVAAERAGSRGRDGAR